MWALILALGLGAAGSDELASRMEVLQSQFEGLQTIEVTPERRAEKDGKLADLRERLNATVASSGDVNELYLAMETVRGWLWENAAARPERVPGDFEETPERWVVETPTLTLAVTREDLRMTVTTPDTTWRFSPCDDGDIVHGGNAFSLLSARARQAEPFHTGYSAGMRLHFSNFPKAPDLGLYLTAYLSGTELVFDLVADETGQELESINWPKAVELPSSEDTLTVCPVMQGALIPGNWPQEIHYANLANSREFYMPWWGHIVDGHGIMAIMETSDDAGGACDHPAGGPTRMAPRWYASLGQLRYIRTIRYVFQPDTTYVSFAKRHRRHVRETNRFVSLREKCLRTPVLRTVVGTPVIHMGSLYHYVLEASMHNTEMREANHQFTSFDDLAGNLRSLKSAGLEHAYVHLDGWGFYGYDSAHPDPLPVGYEQGGWDGLRRFAKTCEDLDYFFAVHDQYRDLYFNAVSFDDRLTVTDLKGERFEVSQWCGGKQTFLSPRYAREYVRRNYDLFAEHGIPVQGSYLDVFAVWPLDESAQPGCPVTRTDCARYRRECFDLLRSRGLVVSSEEPTDYIVGAIDMVHHAPFGLHPHVWAGEEALGIPVPLFSLVYHDSLIVPWDLRQSGAWGVPKGMAAHLHCLLHAGSPYAAPPYGASAAEPFPLELVREAADLAKHCAFLEMTNHEFLSPERTKQRTTFSDGTRVTVDFANGEYDIQLGK